MSNTCWLCDKSITSILDETTYMDLYLHRSCKYKIKCTRLSRKIGSKRPREPYSHRKHYERFIDEYSPYKRKISITYYSPESGG